MPQWHAPILIALLTTRPSQTTSRYQRCRPAAPRHTHHCPAGQFLSKFIAIQSTRALLQREPCHVVDDQSMLNLWRGVRWRIAARHIGAVNKRQAVLLRVEAVVTVEVAVEVEVAAAEAAREE